MSDVAAAPKPTPAPKPPQQRTNAVVEEATQQRLFAEALEHGRKPWSLDSQPAHVRAAVNGLISQVEGQMQKLTSGARATRPLTAVQALVQNAWMIGFHAGRHYETLLAKERRSRSVAQGKATKAARKVTTSSKADKPAQP